MVLTAWCVAVVLGSIFAAGLPLCWLLNGRRPLSRSAHVLAPFLGMAAIILILQNLVYLDVPLKWATPFVWAGILLLWCWFYRSGQLGASLKQCPRALLMAGLLVYMIQGLGLFRLGAEVYVGRARTDQFNYTCLAQFLMDEPFSTRLEDLGKRPYLVPALVIKDDRIGQSVLHGFFAVSCFLEARPLFEPTILLSPALLVLAVFALGQRLGLGSGHALATGVAAGLLPGVTLVHLESFLSHALALPLLLLWPALVDELAEQPHWRRLGTAALILTAAVSIYTELWPVLMGVSLVVLGLALRTRAQAWRLLGCCAALASAPFLLNLGFLSTFRIIMGRLDIPLFAEIYPWAFQLEGLGRLWLGDLAAAPPGLRQSVTRLGTVAAMFLAYYGLVRLCLTHRTARPAEAAEGPGRPVGLALSLLAVALLPVLVFARDDQHPYQFYKLLLTVCPLLLVGLALLGKPRSSAPAGSLVEGPGAYFRRKDCQSVLPLLTLVPLLVLSLAGTAQMVLKSRLATPLPRSLSHILLAPDLRDLAGYLENLHDQRVLIASADPSLDGPHNSWRSAWLAYFARHNQVWVADPEVNDIEPERVPEAVDTIYPTGLPERLLILASRKNGLRGTAPSGATLAWSNNSYLLWQTGNRDWAIPAALTNPNGLEEVDGQPFFWLGRDKATLIVVAGRPGTVTLEGKFRPGPSGPHSAVRRLRIRTNQGYRRDLLLRGGTASWMVPVVEGANEIALIALDRPDCRPVSATDSRTLILGVQGLWLKFTPCRPGPQPGHAAAGASRSAAGS